MSEQWSVYMIRYASDRLYTGVTTDVQRRFLEHSSSGPRAAKALKGKGPYQLVYQREVGSRSEALSLECEIKKMNKQDKLALIESS